MKRHILFVDNHLLVINKPAGMLAQADRTGDPDVLTLGKAYLKERFDRPGKVFLGLVHRLDRPVSGVMVLARTSKAAARLSAQFRERTPHKAYLALVEGRLTETAGSYTDFLLKTGRRVDVVADGRGGRAVLHWRVVATGRAETLVAVRLETGRPHQIRVQFAHRGHPLVGDLRYGATRPFDGRNLALHCYRLAVIHPTLRTPVAWTAPPPETWRGPWYEAALDLMRAPEGRG